MSGGQRVRVSFFRHLPASMANAELVKLLLNNMGDGVGLLIFWLMFIVPTFLTKAASALSSWVLGLWARQYELQDPAQVSVI